MHNTNSDLFAVIAVALGRIPYKDLAPMTDRSHTKREELRHELARYLEESLLPHFEIKRRPANYGGPPFSGHVAAKPADMVSFKPKGWRGKL